MGLSTGSNFLGTYKGYSLYAKNIVGAGVQIYRNSVLVSQAQDKTGAYKWIDAQAVNLPQATTEPIITVPTIPIETDEAEQASTSPTITEVGTVPVSAFITTAMPQTEDVGEPIKGLIFGLGLLLVLGLVLSK